jgi:hypothetical protein
MKKIALGILTIALFSLLPESGKAQAWTKDSKVLSIGIGGSNFWYFGNNTYVNNGGINRRYNYGWPLTGQFNFQGEFGIHDYVGLGFTTGFGGRPGWAYNSSGLVNVPIGFVANFHFYQLIEDKTSKDIHGDKLDIYGGLSLGSGIGAIFFNNGDAVVTPIVFGGPHVGIRYYFTPRVAVNGELGWGKSWLNAGFSFKL